jgi:hypothetical protein
MIAERGKFARVGYLLSIFVGTQKRKMLYVWQLAASKNGLPAGAIHDLLLALRSFMRRKQVQRVFFTAVPKSAELRAIRRYAYSLFGTPLRDQQVVPASVSRGEREFMVKIK